MNDPFERAIIGILVNLHISTAILYIFYVENVVKYRLKCVNLLWVPNDSLKRVVYLEEFLPVCTPREIFSKSY